MILTLKIIPSPELTQVSRLVKAEEFGPELETCMSDMAETMYAHTGVGLAGVQVGDMRRILVADLGYVRTRRYGGNTVFMVNPEIIEKAEEENKTSEGCLSFPALEAFVMRPDWVVVKYQTPFGEEKVERFNGYEARIILHEMDHFNGITIHDGLSNFKRRRYQKTLSKKLKKLGEILANKAGQ